MMDTNTKFGIESPESLTVTMVLAESVPVELVLERHLHRDEYSQQLIQEFVTAADISVPVTINEDSLPFALLTKVNRPSAPTDKASISIRIIGKRNIRIKLMNLDFLKNVFGKDASMKLVVFHNGALRNWQTEEMEIRESESNVETSVWISEDVDELIKQVGRRKRYRTAYGEVTSLTGNFTIQAKWIINPRPNSNQLSTKFDRHQKFILAKSFDHTVDLVSSNGKIFKVSKALLAAYSEKIERQLQFLLDDQTDAKTYKAIKVFTGRNSENGDNHYLDEQSLRAFVRFVIMSSITEPLNDPALCLELMMTASYNMITELEKAMGLILLAQPLEIYNVETSVYLFGFSSINFETLSTDSELTSFWNRLKVRALWNLKGTPKEELLHCPAMEELFPKETCRSRFLSSL